MTRNANMVRKTYGAGALLALAVLFIGVTIIISFVLRGARFDFATRNGGKAGHQGIHLEV